MQRAYKIGKTFKFCASHELKSLGKGHPCSSPHGHNYKVELIMRMIHLNVKGMVEDFNAFEDVEKMIKRRLDHSCLNNEIEQPTAENIAKFIFDWSMTTHKYLYSVKVWETDDCWAEYTIE